MSKHETEEEVAMSSRLRHLEQLVSPRVVAPRPPHEAETFPPLVDVEPHTGRMYVVGREPHFCAVTLLRPARR